MSSSLPGASQLPCTDLDLGSTILATTGQGPADCRPDPKNPARVVWYFERNAQLVSAVVQWVQGTLQVSDADVAAARRRLRAQAVLAREQDGGAR